MDGEFPHRDAGAGDDANVLRAELHRALSRDMREALRLYRRLWSICKSAVAALGPNDTAAASKIQELAEASLTRKSISHYNALLRSSWTPHVAALDLFGAFGSDGFKSADFLRGVRVLAENGCLWHHALDLLAESRRRRQTEVTRQGVVRRGKEWIAWDGMQAMEGFLGDEAAQQQSQSPHELPSHREIDTTSPENPQDTPSPQVNGGYTFNDRERIMDINDLWTSTTFVDAVSPLDTDDVEMSSTETALEPVDFQQYEEASDLLPASLDRAYTWPGADWSSFGLSTNCDPCLPTANQAALPSFSRPTSKPLNSSSHYSTIIQKMHCYNDNSDKDSDGQMARPKTLSLALGNLPDYSNLLHELIESPAPETLVPHQQSGMHEKARHTSSAQFSLAMHTLHPFFVKSGTTPHRNQRGTDRFSSTQTPNFLRRNSEGNDCRFFGFESTGTGSSLVVDLQEHTSSAEGSCESHLWSFVYPNPSVGVDSHGCKDDAPYQASLGSSPSQCRLDDLLPQQRLHGATLTAIMRLLKPNMDSVYIFESRTCSRSDPDPLLDRACRPLTQEDVEHIYFPLNFDQCHWILGHLDTKHQLYGIYDPLQSQSFREAGLAALQAFVTNADIDIAEWSEMCTYVNLPRQCNDFDCGLLVAIASVLSMHDRADTAIKYPDLWRRVLYTALYSLLQTSDNPSVPSPPFLPEQRTKSKVNGLHKDASEKLAAHLGADTTIADILLSSSASTDAIHYRLSINESLITYLEDSIAELDLIRTLAQDVSDEDQRILTQVTAIKADLQRCQQLLELSLELQGSPSGLQLKNAASEAAENLSTMEARLKPLSGPVTTARSRAKALEAMMECVDADLDWYREKIATLKSESSELRTRLETVAHQLLLSIGGATAM